MARCCVPFLVGMLIALPSRASAQQNSGILIPGMTTSDSGQTQDVGGTSGSRNQSLSIHGGRNNDQMLLVDGGPIAQSEVGGPSSMVYPDASTQEITLITGMLQAEQETGGVRINIIPKSGGNSFRGVVFGAYTNEHLQSNNLTSDLISLGLPRAEHIQTIYDVNPSIGGPILQDRIWFYLGARRMFDALYSAALYNTNPAGVYRRADDSVYWGYVPDLTRGQVPTEDRNWNGTIRLTVQASPKNKVNLDAVYERRCACPQFLSPTVSYEPSSIALYPSRFFQAVWQSTLTNKLLIEAGTSFYLSMMENRPLETVVPPSALEQATGVEIRARETTPQSLNEAYPRFVWNNYSVRGSVSYVTGAHAFKAGVQINPQTDLLDRRGLADYQVLLLNGTPNAVRFFPMRLRFLKVEY